MYVKISYWNVKVNNEYNGEKKKDYLSYVTDQWPISQGGCHRWHLSKTWEQSLILK